MAKYYDNENARWFIRDWFKGHPFKPRMLLTWPLFGIHMTGVGITGAIVLLGVAINDLNAKVFGYKLFGITLYDPDEQRGTQ